MSSQEKICRICGETFLDESMFLRENLCDTCAIKEPIKIYSDIDEL
jgi:formylmethanofuran dehydrogenase subunit E